MASTFNTLLNDAGIALRDVRLLRHKDKHSTKGRSICELWRNERPSFDQYQSLQKFIDRSNLASPLWASFVVTLEEETLFVGLYRVGERKLLDRDTPWPHGPGMDKAGECDKYELTLDERLSGFIGQLVVDWGEGFRSWIQRADRQDKRIIRGGSEHGLASDLAGIIGQPNASLTTIKAQVDARLGQGAFRTSVLRLWGDCCAVTGASTAPAIRASHIKPWRDSTDDERLDPNNGLPLVASLDALFDAGLISFEASGRMLVSPNLGSKDQGIFGLAGKSLRNEPSDELAEYLAHHRAKIFQV